MSTTDILNTLIKYTPSNSAGNLLQLPDAAFGAGEIQTALTAFFAEGQFQVTLDAAMTAGSASVKVTGQGANSPLSDLALEADFSDGSDGVDLSLSATLVSAWTFSSAFPAVSGTFFNNLEVISGNLTLNSAGGGATVSLLGNLTLTTGGNPLGTGFFEARHDDSGNGFLIGVLVPEALSPGTIWPDLNALFEKLTFSNSGMIVSTIEVAASDFPQLTMPSLPAEFKPGVTFFTSMALEGDGFGLLSELFAETVELDLSVYIDTPSNYAIEALLPGSGGQGTLIFDGLSLTLTPSPITVTVSASATLNIGGETIGLQGDGSIILEPTPKVDFDIQVENWNEPFGIKGLNIQDFGLNVAIEDAGVTLGFLGQFEIGVSDPFVLTVGGDLVDFEDPGALVFELTDPDPNNPLKVTDLIQQFTSLNLSHVPLLNGLAFKDFEFWVVVDPSGSWTAPNGDVFPDGIGLSADVLLYSWELTLKIQVEDTNGIIASGAINDPVTLFNVLTLSDSTGTKGPSASIDTTQFAGGGDTAQVADASPYFSLSGAVKCLGLDESFSGSVSDDGFEVNFQADLARLFTASFSASYSQGQSFAGAASGSFDFELDTPELEIGGVPVIPAVHVSGPSASLDMSVAISTADASVSFALSFTWGSFNFDVKFALDSQQVVNLLSDLWNNIVNWIKSNLRVFYQSVLADVGAFVQAIKDGVLKLGQDAEYVARALVAGFSAVAQDVAKYLQQIGYEFDDMVNALVNVFNISVNKAVSYLKSCAMDTANYYISNPQSSV